MKTLLILDLDGTVAHGGRRFEKAGEEPNKEDRDQYMQWLERIQDDKSLLEDKPVSGMSELAHSFTRHYDIVYLTSREQKYSSVTHQWLLKHGFPLADIIMRPTGSFEDTADFKEGHIAALQGYGDYDNILVIDDDVTGELEKRCHKNGWTFLKALSGGNGSK